MALLVWSLIENAALHLYFTITFVPKGALPHKKMIVTLGIIFIISLSQSQLIPMQYALDMPPSSLRGHVQWGPQDWIL